MPIIKENLERKDKRLLAKIKSPTAYKFISAFIFLIFWFKKKYFVFWNKKEKKKTWLVSITTDRILWNKLSYIDDFIVHKRGRGKWIWNKLFAKAVNKAENEEKSDYVFLVTKKERKSSHSIYKKFGFSLISLGVWYLAYKKVKK